MELWLQLPRWVRMLLACAFLSGPLYMLMRGTIWGWGLGIGISLFMLALPAKLGPRPQRRLNWPSQCPMCGEACYHGQLVCKSCGERL
jgi:hypothetical protein